MSQQKDGHEAAGRISEDSHATSSPRGSIDSSTALTPSASTRRQYDTVSKSNVASQSASVNGNVREANEDVTGTPQVANGNDTKAEASPSKARRYLELAKWFLLDQWFLVALIVLIVISSQVQVPQSQQAVKETVVTYLCVSIIFFITGCTLSTRTLIENYAKWKIHLYVQAGSFLMTSAVVFGIVSLCATNPGFMDEWLLIGLIFMGSVPTTISSNVVMTRQAGGTTALTVTESMISNFLGPFLTPLLVTMYTSSGAYYTRVLPANGDDYGEIYRRVFKQLGLSLFLPFTVGQILLNLFPTFTNKLMSTYKFSKLSSFSLLIIIWQTYDQAFATGAFDSVDGSNIVFIVFVGIGLFVLFLVLTLATALPWLSREDTIAASYCIPAKTPAMGVPIVTTMFVGLKTIDQSKLQIPMVIYQGLQVAAGSLLTIAFRKWLEGRRKKADEENSENDEGGST